MKIGDYVRTNNGGIGKIINCPFKTMYLDEIWGDIEDTETIITNNVYKTSPNIIDLIEENDLLKIEYYSLRYEGRVTRLFEVTYKDKKNINLSNAKCDFMLTNNDFSNSDKELEPIIKSIVTKEQFERMEYKCIN